jgi:hypothetical protein
MKHSPEPWRADLRFVSSDRDDYGIEIMSGETIVAFAASHHFRSGPENCDDVCDNARRIVACVNACQGWTTEELTDRVFRKTGMNTPCGVPGGGRPVALLSRDTQWTDKAQECKEALKNAPSGEIFGVAVSDSQPGPDGSHRVWVAPYHTETIEDVAEKYGLKPEDLKHPIDYGD